MSHKAAAKRLVSADIRPRYAILESKESATEWAWEKRAVRVKLCDNKSKA